MFKDRIKGVVSKTKKIKIKILMCETNCWNKFINNS